jgi:hypothetical protein
LEHPVGAFPYFALILLFASCSPHNLPSFRDDIGPGQAVPSSPDYSQSRYWAVFPGKKSLADSIPPALPASYSPDSSVDVFFIHPTTLVSDKDSQWNASLDDTTLNDKTDRTTILFQASVFNECRIYAPRYRQAHLRTYFTKDTLTARRTFELAYEDVRSAFLYYLAHYNHGRPIILASHSQGTTHAERLLREFFDNQPLQHQLVAAYIIGMAIPRDSFSVLHPCTDSASTGCLIGWRTFKEGYEPDYVQKEKSGSWIVNPLTWDTTEEEAPRTLNKGSVLLNFKKVLPEVADARIHDGILWVHRPHFPGSFLIRSKNYHIGDINLFYVNIRENVRTRIRAYRAGLQTH